MLASNTTLGALDHLFSHCSGLGLSDCCLNIVNARLPLLRRIRMQNQDYELSQRFMRNHWCLSLQTFKTGRERGRGTFSHYCLHAHECRENANPIRLKGGKCFMIKGSITEKESNWEAVHTVCTARTASARFQEIWGERFCSCPSLRRSCLLSGIGLKDPLTLVFITHSFLSLFRPFSLLPRNSPSTKQTIAHACDVAFGMIAGELKAA